MRRVDIGLLPLLSRRDALLGGAAGLAACAVPKGADDTGVGGDPIQHVIVLMMENRSFDHFLGGLLLDEGRDGLDGLTVDHTNLDTAGNEHGPRPSEVDCLYDPPHSWNSAREQFAEGTNAGFILAYEADDAPRPAEVMGYLQRADVPITWALADAYAVCDQYFCSVMGPTWPNRLYGHAGTSDGRTNNDFPDGGTFDFPTAWTQLDAVGVAWRYYYIDVPFIALFDGHFREGNNAFVEDFFDDVAAGDLPPVTWIDPGFTYNDDHPPHHVGLGQELIASVYKALAASPLADKFLLVITYDEHGGFYDHVPPPTTADDFAAEGFDQLGFRVPTLVVGPYARQAVVHDVLDHTSWLKYLCERYGIAPWTARIEAATSIGVALDADRLAARSPRPLVDVPAFDIDDEALGGECFSVRATAFDALAEHGAHLPPLAAAAEARHPGSVRLDVTPAAVAIRRWAARP